MTMGLTNRRTLPKASSSQSDSSDTDKKSGRRGSFLLVTIFLAAAVVASFVLRGIPGEVTKSFLKGASSSPITGKNSFQIAPKVRLFVDFAFGDGDVPVSLGPHKVSLLVDDQKACTNPGFWLRLEGDALVGILLHEIEGGDMWSGSFSFPFEGNYQLVSFWYGCDSQGSKERKQLMTDVVAKGESSNNLEKRTSMFPASVWISSKKFPQAQEIPQPYVWHDPKVPTKKATLMKTSETILSKEGTAREPDRFYEFKSLSNYELVCWIGSESAQSLKSAFLQIRPLISAAQRPFKFHMYPIHHFVKPDRDWNDSNKTRFRKCKHILVSLDELQDSVSQKEYIKQVETFVHHLRQAFTDATFPIWLFTMLTSPTQATNCHTPFLPRSSDHPCNAVLKDMFRDESPFPPRVRFLDSTEITLPQLDDNPKDVVAAIALRIFVFVGKQVQEWRASGQLGTVQGLVRGDKTEPNFELVPYSGWS